MAEERRSRGGGRGRRVVPRLERVRSLRGSRYGWLDVDLLRRGFLRALAPEAVAVYAFLCLVADREGVSFYRRARIGEALGLDDQQVYRALARLRELDLLAYAPFHPSAPDGFHQVLSLPAERLAPLMDERLSRLVSRLDPGRAPERRPTE